MKGLVFDIKRYSINDGPGIRTTIFFKGCPLKCLWCHNPESQSFERQFFYYKDKCISCKFCVASCPADSIKFVDGALKRGECNFCLKCEEVCPGNSIKSVGSYYSAEDVLDFVVKDYHFYGQSGGVTFSGGEPLFQFDFLIETLKLLKKENLNIAIDTSGFIATEKILEAAKYTDIFLYDIKHFDSSKHKILTGVDNTLILKNLKELSNSGANIIVRIPIIPGINDDEENLINIKKFVKSLQAKIKIEPVFYHNIMQGKYELCGKKYLLNDIVVPDNSYKREKSRVLGVDYDEANRM